MFKAIRNFFHIRSKEEKYIDGYNAIVEAVKDKEWDLMRDLYYCAVDNDIDFDSFDKGIIRAYRDFHNNGTLNEITLADIQKGDHNV